MHMVAPQRYPPNKIRCRHYSLQTHEHPSQFWSEHPIVFYSEQRMLSDLQQATPHRNRNRVRPIVSAQLVHEISDVIVDGSLRDGELIGDLLVTIAIANQSQNLQLSAGEIFIA